MKYVFDTSSLLQMKNYPPNSGIPYFDKIWRKFGLFIKNKKVIVITEVYYEVKDFGNRDEPIIDFLINNRKYIQEYTVPMQLTIRKVINDYKQLIGRFSTKNGADLFVIGVAKYIEGVIVTEEKYKKDSLKIPNIAEKERLESINFIEFLNREKIK